MRALIRWTSTATVAALSLIATRADAGEVPLSSQESPDWATASEGSWLPLQVEATARRAGSWSASPSQFATLGLVGWLAPEGGLGLADAPRVQPPAAPTAVPANATTVEIRALGLDFVPVDGANDVSSFALKFSYRKPGTGQVSVPMEVRLIDDISQLFSNTAPVVWNRSVTLLGGQSNTYGGMRVTLPSGVNLARKFFVVRIVGCDNTTCLAPTAATPRPKVSVPINEYRTSGSDVVIPVRLAQSHVTGVEGGTVTLTIEGQTWQRSFGAIPKSQTLQFGMAVPRSNIGKQATLSVYSPYASEWSGTTYSGAVRTP